MAQIGLCGCVGMACRAVKPVALGAGLLATVAVMAGMAPEPDPIPRRWELELEAGSLRAISLVTDDRGTTDPSDDIYGDFTLADVVLGVSVHRWIKTPMDRANLPAVEAYYARLKERPEFGRWARDDVP